MVCQAVARLQLVTPLIIAAMPYFMEKCIFARQYPMEKCNMLYIVSKKGNIYYLPIYYVMFLENKIPDHEHLYF